MYCNRITRCTFNLLTFTLVCRSTRPSSLSSTLLCLCLSQVFLQWSSCAHDCKTTGGVLHQRYHYFPTTTVEDQRGASSKSPAPPSFSLSIALSLSFSTIHFSSLSLEVPHTLTLYWRDWRGRPSARKVKGHVREKQGAPVQNMWSFLKLSSGPVDFYSFFSPRWSVFFIAMM